MDEARVLVFSEERQPERLDLFVGGEMPGVSRVQIKRLIDEGLILVDGAPSKASARLRGGEEIRITLPDPQPANAQPEAIPLRVLYEDSDLIVIDKPAGLVVHPAAGHASGTLVNALLYHCGDLSGIGGELRPGIVHRLDKDTSGVMVATKNDATHIALAAQFKAHTVNRRYLALLHGLLTPTSGQIDTEIGRHPNHRLKMSSQGRQTKTAVTHWKVQSLYQADRLSLVELRLETGRTHQIRVHFSERNMPLVHDPLYGGKIRTGALQDVQLKKLAQTLPGQALHARLLGFVHPRSQEYLEFASDLPPAFAELIDYLTHKYTDESL
ncbi:RluA family pseudouridine synthase [Geopsychrobacter electrodiphilus]|uniref:RluA family pseudouridine synthase n=1 Tax=Geopsychrobacter electrodiphilus TaxID=225196 RepID=UPI000370ACEB|nr:RluA family pseudouridine synthase [Geopsychrobacter electrodiphilus]